jgi:hypothetical protein
MDEPVKPRLTSGPRLARMADPRSKHDQDVVVFGHGGDIFRAIYFSDYNSPNLDLALELGMKNNPALKSLSNSASYMGLASFQPLGRDLPCTCLSRFKSYGQSLPCKDFSLKPYRLLPGIDF